MLLVLLCVCNIKFFILKIQILKRFFFNKVNELSLYLSKHRKSYKREFGTASYSYLYFKRSDGLAKSQFGKS